MERIPTIFFPQSPQICLIRSSNKRKFILYILQFIGRNDTQNWMIKIILKIY